MYDNLTNEVKTNEKMALKIHIRHSPHWQMGPCQFLNFLLKTFTLSYFLYLHLNYSIVARGCSAGGDANS